jgi:hypothetical protein
MVFYSLLKCSFIGDCYSFRGNIFLHPQVSELQDVVTQKATILIFIPV